MSNNMTAAEVAEKLLYASEQNEAFSAVQNPEVSAESKVYALMLRTASDILRKYAAGELVEVVRCKDCISHHIESYGEEWCGRFDGGMGLSGDDYCSCGVKKGRRPIPC